MPVATLPAIRISRSFDATAEEVFAAWTTPALLAEWFGPGTIETEVQELDPVAGGRYRIRMNDSDNGKVHVVHGRFVDLDPPSRLVMTWQWEEEGSYESQVTSFAEARERTLEFARTTRADLRAHFVRNPLFTLDGVQWLLFVAAHNERHLLQIQEVKDSPGFPSS